MQLLESKCENILHFQNYIFLNNKSKSKNEFDNAKASHYQDSLNLILDTTCG